MIQEIFLKMSLPNWLFTIFIIILFGIAFLYYYKTLPPLSSFRRNLSFLLRAISLAIMMFLILEPVLRLLYQYSEKPVVAVLFDNSASMKIKESYGARGDSLKYIAEYLNNQPFEDSLEILPLQFDITARNWNQDSLAFDVDGSNITRAISTVLDSISGKNIQAMVLISDGIYTQGPNPFLPARNSLTPIYTVTIGDSAAPKDIAIRRINTNQVTYVKKKLPVETVFWQNGFEGNKVLLSIKNKGRILAQRMIGLGRSGFEQKETLEVTFKEAGDFNLSVSIQGLEGEVTRRNNQRVARVQVLKSKIKVLVISGAPNFDRQALSHIGKQLKDYDFTYLTEKSRGKYFEQSFREAKVDSQDLLICYGFPTQHSDPSHLQKIMKQVDKRRIPLFWFLSRDFYYQKLLPYEQLLPFQRVGRLTPTENQLVSLTRGGRLHPATKIDDNESANSLLWKELPPIETYKQIKVKPGAQILMEPTIGPQGQANLHPDLAIVFAYRYKEIKQLVFNGSNFGNWHFQLQNDPARNQFFIRFMERSIRWLVNRDDIHQIQISPLQKIYNVGEQVVFSGQVYDELYHPVSDAQVVVSINSDTLKFSDEMTAEGNGYYRQFFAGLPEGEFLYRVEAKRNGKNIGARSGKITINPFFLEFQQIPANYALMSQIAQQTGGKAYTPQEFVNKFPEKKLEQRVQFSFTEFFVWNYWQWLCALIILLGTEWFLRKKWGLL